MKPIKIDENQKKIVLSVLRKYFVNEKYFVFGSRATNKNLKSFSDLDIAIQSAGKISTSDLAKASEDLAASDLPFKVDLIDLNSISEEFRLNIQGELVEFS